MLISEACFVFFYYSYIFSIAEHHFNFNWILKIWILEGILIYKSVSIAFVSEAFCDNRRKSDIVCDQTCVCYLKQPHPFPLDFECLRRVERV